MKALINHAGSKSLVIPTPAFAVKGVLATLDKMDWTLMTREQYAIADEDYVVDVEDLRETYGRIIQAWNEWKANPDPDHLQRLFVPTPEWEAFVQSQSAPA